MKVSKLERAHDDIPEIPGVRDARQPRRAFIVSALANTRLRQFIGAAILLTVILFIIAFNVLPDPAPDLTVVTGYGGGLKVDFLNDPEVKEILEEEYNLLVDITEVGSLDIACNIDFEQGDDFVWLGDSVALQQHRDCGGIVRATENIYYSPVVLYSWTPIVDALVAKGLATREQDGSYSVDFAKLTEYVEAGQTWEDLGVPGMHDKVSVQTTDPRRSNSGFLFAGMLANTMNGGAVVNTTTVAPLLPRTQTFILRSGYMPSRSSELWNLFLITGMGAKPIVTLYESQVIEHIVANPSQINYINQNVRILYPEPTVWATHPYVARTPEGERLMEVLFDPDIQRLASERHGQRSSLPSVPFKPAVDGIRTNVTSVVSMPSSAVMDLILAAINEAISGTMPPPGLASPVATLPDE